MYFKSKTFKNNTFVLYDENDEVICYLDNFNEVCNYLNYKLSDLVHEYNRRNTYIINVKIDNKKYKLATFR
ncbi:MAG: hypothetical protein Q4E75_00710 [bacterium]|nr:hypothetical protein [bacterium]